LIALIINIHTLGRMLNCTLAHDPKIISASPR